jgi:hypothetical protein
MITGTAGNLGGVTTAATLPIIAVGAALTLGPALSRIHYTVNEKHFRGSSNLLNAFQLDYVKNIVSPHHPLKLILRAAAQGENAESLEKTEVAFKNASYKLAVMKALSLIHTANNRSNACAEEKWSALQQKLLVFSKRSNKGLLQKTWQHFQGEVYEDIETSIAQEVVLLINNHKSDITRLYEQGKTATSLVLLKTAANYVQPNMEYCKSLSACLQSDALIDQADAKQLSYLKISLDNKLPLDTSSVKNMDITKFTTISLARGKQTMKAIRFQLADSITTLSLAMQAKEQLETDQETKDTWKYRLNRQVGSKSNFQK